MGIEAPLFHSHERKTRTNHQSHFPVGTVAAPYEKDLPRNTGDDVRGQETTNQDTREPVCEAGGENTAQADDTQSVQGVEKETTTKNYLDK